MRFPARELLHDAVIDGRDFIVMEYANGTSLDQYIESGNHTREAVLDVAIQISDRLAAAHKAGIAHRDIKPANIQIDGQGRVKILSPVLTPF